MWQDLLDRLRMQWAVVRRPSWRWLFYGWVAVSVFDTAVAQFTPRDIQEMVPNVYEIFEFLLPGWSLTTWFLIGLVGLNLATLEFAFRQYKKHTTADAEAAVESEASQTPYAEWSDLDQIDLVTAAGIYAGTLESTDIVRHLRFRELKQAARERELKVFKMNGPKPNMKTTVKPSDLKEYLENVARQTS